MVVLVGGWVKRLLERLRYSITHCQRAEPDSMLEGHTVLGGPNPCDGKLPGRVHLDCRSPYKEGRILDTPSMSAAVTYSITRQKTGSSEEWTCYLG